MRILFVSNYYPPYEVGGYEQLCRDVALRLEARGHVIEVLTSDRGALRDAVLDEPGIHRKLRIQPRYDATPGPAVQFLLSRRRAEAYNRRVFGAVVEKVRPDVVFFWNLEGLPHELAMDAEASPGMAVAYWLAGASPAAPDAFWQYWALSPQKHAFLGSLKGQLKPVALMQMRREGKPVRPQMLHVGVVSEYMRQKGLEEKTLPAHAEVIYNGVETDRFYQPVPAPDELPPVRLLLAGRVSPDKGVHVAIEAIGRLAQVRSPRDVHLVVAGTGPAEYLQELHQLAVAYSIRAMHLVSRLVASRPDARPYEDVTGSLTSDRIPGAFCARGTRGDGGWPGGDRYVDGWQWGVVAGRRQQSDLHSRRPRGLGAPDWPAPG